MKKQLSDLTPYSLWNHFNRLSEIPRPTGHMEDVSRYITDFAEKQNLSFKKDKAGNIVVYKPAVAGKENCKTIVLQAHLDMVPQKNAGTSHDFFRDPILPYVDGDYVTAGKTTLGADNGIGVAAILALLESNEISHGDIEALFTINEEVGMEGALSLTPDFISGSVLLNTDSEEEGELFVGCAGGQDLDIEFGYKPEKEAPSDEEEPVRIALTGLKGGHSGVDIHRGRANANKLLFRFLKMAVQRYEARLSWVQGGSLRNAIPREAFAVVTVLKELKDDLLDEVAQFESIFRKEYEGIEDNLSFKGEGAPMPESWIPEPIQDDLINAVVASFNGVNRYLPLMPDTVESSSNLASVVTEDGRVLIKILVRGTYETVKNSISSSLESLFSLAGAKVDFSASYCGWMPHFDSPAMKIMSSVYEQMYGRKPKAKVMHAGLECGIINSIYPNLDIVSFGPTIMYPHSPDEKVDIASVKRFYDFLVKSVENIAIKD